MKKPITDDPADWREKIDKIMDAFDFGKVRRVMEFLGWKWHTDDGMRVPEEPVIRAEARRLLIMAISLGESGSIISGGLEATRFEGDLSLSFEVEQHTVYEQDEQ